MLIELISMKYNKDKKMKLKEKENEMNNSKYERNKNIILKMDNK